MKKYAIAFMHIMIFISSEEVFSQSCSGMNIQWQSDIPSLCAEMTMTMMHDQLNRPYLYVANKEAGLKIYDISDLAAPSLAATIPTTAFNSLQVMNLTQDSHYLYLSVGNIFSTNPQSAGMAIVDVADPVAPVVTDYWTLPSSQTGAGIVKVEGTYAYLGAMRNGLVILDISDKYNIQFVSQYKPAIDYPPVAYPDSLKINARGMEVRNSIVYLCYDAGGIRIINCTNHLIPAETGRWCNPAMYTPFDHPKAYNNCVLDDTLLYVAVDYAGLEVLNIADTSNIQMLGWWNPYNAPANNWFTSPVHANEIQYEENCQRLYLSTGKSDMYVIDVSNPAIPDSCNYYGGVLNNIGTWGIGVWQDEIYLSYICAVVPFLSDWTGVKILSFDPCVTGIAESNKASILSISPNPFYNETVLQAGHIVRNATITITNCSGQTIKQIKNFSGQSITLQRDDLPSGLYFLRLTEDKAAITTKLWVMD